MDIQLILVNCQSNEKGSGEQIDLNTGRGKPLIDPLVPYGTAGEASMWPKLAELFGNAGHRLTVLNTARPSTSGPMGWTGALYAHGTSKIFGVGAYISVAGNIYKCTNSTGGSSINGQTAASAPTWPGSGTVVDGQLTWTYLRAASGGDIVGTVYREGDTLFDPNSYIANALGFSLDKSKFHRNIVLLQNGQQDATLQTPRSIYRDAILSAGDYFDGRGWRIMAGFTFYAPALASWMDSDLIPGIADALAARPGWYASANLRSTLGNLPTNPADNTPAVGLRPDALHANRLALRAAAADVFAAMQASGVLA